MKFEKFLKQVGTHGEVIERGESEKWLVCDGVGMIIPRGVDNLLGMRRDREYASIVDALATAEMDDPLTLIQAVLLDPTGNAKSIYRLFETRFGDVVGITNTDYGLLEKKDLLGYCEITIPKTETTNEYTVKYVLVYNQNGDIQGFITGSNNF